VSAAPLWMLRVLYEQETADPFLTPVLKRVEPEVRRRIDAPLARSNWDAHQLRQLLTPVLVGASSGTSTG